MTFRPFYFALILMCALGSAHATTPKEQYNTETREAADRYAEDMAICKEERDRKKRAQCSKVAKDAKIKSLGEALARLGKAPKVNATK
ncbi:MAG: hypothetical protein V4633_13845 [Pseudomonadota bacterium]